MSIDNVTYLANSNIAWWISPRSYQITTMPRYDATRGAVHPSIAK